MILNQEGHKLCEYIKIKAASIYLHFYDSYLMTSFLSDFFFKITGSDTVLDMIGQSIWDFISKLSQKSFSPKVRSS